MRHILIITEDKIVPIQLSMQINTEIHIQLLKRIIQATPQMINNFSGMVDYIKIQNDFTISVGGNYSNTKQIMIQKLQLTKEIL